MSDQPVKQKGIHYAWWVSISVFLTQFILIVGVQGAGVVLSFIAQDLGVAVAAAAFIVSCFNIGQVVGASIWGALVDKIGLRKTFSLGSLTGALTIILFGLFSVSLVLACILSCLMGIAMAGIRDATIPKLISTWFAPSMRGKGVIPASLGGTVAGTVLGIVIPMLLTNFTWGMSYVIMGVVGLVISVIVFLVVRDDPADLGMVPCGAAPGTKVERASAPEGGKKAKGGMGAAFKDMNAWVLGIIYLLFQIFLVSNMNYIVTVVMEAGYDTAAAGLCVSIFSLLMCLSQVVFSALTDRIVIKYIFTILFAGCTVGALLMFFFLDSVDLMFVYVIIGIVGLFMGVTPIVQTQSAELFPVSMRGAGSGAVASLGMIGGIVGPLVSAAVITASGGATIGYLPVCIVAGAVACLMSLFLLPKTGGKIGDPFLNADGTEKDLSEVVLKR